MSTIGDFLFVISQNDDGDVYLSMLSPGSASLARYMERNPSMNYLYLTGPDPVRDELSIDINLSDNLRDRKMGIIGKIATPTMKWIAE